ncbi:hypothetical protein DXG01_005240 [Tephrocybe rancida]|nr:hypothetical protein DXG01_005240 [Tephrocybe rancida]
MFTNRISRIRRLTAGLRTYSAAPQSTYPFTKLRAFPFEISPEDAITEMAPYASSICLFKELIGSLGARFIPGFGFKPLRPVRITPVYFPGWIIDAEVSVDVTCGDVQHRTSGIAQDSYVNVIHDTNNIAELVPDICQVLVLETCPFMWFSNASRIGSDFQVLSWVSYRSDEIITTEKTVPFTESLKHQHGVDVTCLPYTISPFAALGLAHSTTDPIRLGDDVSIAPKTLDSDMFAAYPVLFPLYLAQYEYPLPGKERLVTLFIEASTAGGRIRSEKLDIGNDVRSLIPMAPRALVDFTHALDEVDVPCLQGTPSPFFGLTGFYSTEKRGLSTLLDHWLNDAVVTHGAGQTLVVNSDLVSDDDPRIRPFTLEERTTVERWLALSQEIESMVRVAVSMRRTHELASASNKVFPQDVFDKTIESLESKIAELQAEQVAITPEWWKEYVHRSE